MDNCQRNCRQNINHDISVNQNPLSTDDKSQKPIKDSNGINSISIAVNIETNVSEALVSPPRNTIKASKTNPGEVNPFNTVRPRKGDKFS